MNPILKSIFDIQAINILNLFIEKQKESIQKFKELYHPSYIDGFNKLFLNGFVPQRFIDMLAKSGWSIEWVDGYLTGIDYFTNILHRKIPIIKNTRPLSQLEYAEFPDMIHDIMGHTPFLLNTEYTSFLHKISYFICNIDLEELDRKYFEYHQSMSDKRKKSIAILEELENSLQLNPTPFYIHNNLALWTIEFGLLGSAQKFQAYGAALVGSPNEIKNLNKRSTSIYSLDRINTNNAFNFSSYQNQLYITEQFEDVLTFHKWLNTHYVGGNGT